MAYFGATPRLLIWFICMVSYAVSVAWALSPLCVECQLPDGRAIPVLLDYLAAALCSVGTHRDTVSDLLCAQFLSATASVHPWNFNYQYYVISEYVRAVRGIQKSKVGQFSVLLEEAPDPLCQKLRANHTKLTTLLFGHRPPRFGQFQAKYPY